MDVSTVVAAIEVAAQAVALVALAVLVVQAGIFMWRSILRRMME